MKKHKTGQQNLLLKNFIQISISLCLKAKRVPFIAHRGRSVLDEIQDLNTTGFERTQRKSQSQIEKLKNVIYLSISLSAAWKFIKTLLLRF